MIKRNLAESFLTQECYIHSRRYSSKQETTLLSEVQVFCKHSKVNIFEQSERQRLVINSVTTSDVSISDLMF